MTEIHSKIIRELEKKMIPVKQAMERRGLNVDLKKLDALIQRTSREKRSIETELKATLGIKNAVNFNSSKDVSKILLDCFGVRPRVTYTGRLSTNRRMLKDLSNPVTDKIVRYRELEKSLSALKAIGVATDKERSKIFCKYLDNCPSGRLYSQGYCFQSIPEIGRTVIRADKGCSFVLMDYDSFELRILSALAHDKYFKNCWEQGLDLHRKVVADMKGIPYEKVTDKERKIGKSLNFGISYGQEPAGLARNLHCSVFEAQKLMAVYKSKITEIEAFKVEVILVARETGFVTTYYGRKRLLSNILSPNAAERKKSERQAINTKIQGSGADIVKFALVKLHEEGFAIDTMLHDGILITLPDNQLQSGIKRIKEIMEIELEGMRLPVSYHTGKWWSECYGK